MTSSRNANTVDLIKFLLAFAIVGIHTGVLNVFPDKTEWYITHLIFRLGVPFFYVVSGFFLASKIKGNEEDKVVLHSYRMKLLIPFSFWTVIGVGGYFWELTAVKDISLGGLLFRIIRVVVFYPPLAMWFVAACIISSIILQLILYKKWDIKVITIIVSCLFLVALFCNTYYFVIEGLVLQNFVDLYLKICISARNGLFLFVYMWMGYLLSRKNIFQWLKKNDKKVNIILIVSCITFFMEVILTYDKNVKDDSSLFISFLVLIPLVVYKSISRNIRRKLPYIELRRISSVVFFTHCAINMFVEKVFRVEEGVLRFAVVSSSCILIYFMFRKTKNIYVKRILQI